MSLQPVMVGRAITKLTRRNDLVVATKVRFKMHDGLGGEGLARRHGWTPFVSMQNQYSLMMREDEKEDRTRLQCSWRARSSVSMATRSLADDGQTRAGW